MKSPLMFRSAGLGSTLLVMFAAAAAAQRPAGAGNPPPPPPSHPQPSPKAAPQATDHPSNQSGAKGEPKNFTGAAKQLGTTPQAMDDAYKAALLTNPKLTRGQFIAANMLAKNLSAKNPAITTQAILDGLGSGKSIGQTLQGLGLSADEAKSAEAEANRDARKGPPADKGKS